MRKLGTIDDTQYREAIAAAVTAEHHGASIAFAAHYVAEMARREMLDRFGIGAYTEGYSVFTTIDSQLQQVAQQALIDGLLTYDRRHGYRGPERRLPDGSEQPEQARAAWQRALEEIPVIAGLTPAVVTAVDEAGVDLLLPQGDSGRLLWDDGLSQARAYISEDSRGAAPRTPAEVLATGNLIRVQRNDESRWELAQVPAAQAALVSLDPDNGAIRSLVGGMGFELSKFNRATQARRQPGSNLKPFLYAAALDAGFTAASIINDAPIVLEDASLEGLWRPVNDSGRFFGPTRLRWALTKSRNLVSIRLLQQLGVQPFIDYLAGLGLDTTGFVPDLSLALGTQAMTPLEVASAYAILANGGYRVTPYLIERIEDIDGRPVFEAAPATVCRDCDAASGVQQVELSMEEILRRDRFPRAERVMDERVHFIIDDILQDVIKRGTGRRALVLERDDIAGKTGTTNGPMDAWFSGYNPGVVTTAWVGFDNYTPLGRREFGGTAALPIWIDYMRVALGDRPQRQRTLPAGISYVRIDPESGLLAPADQRDAIFEYFRDEYVPEASEDATATGQVGTDELIQEIF
jgi:penicillin-binding protein 1A